MRSVTLVLLLFAICLVSSCVERMRGEQAFDGRYNICDYGAVGDGETLNTEAINAAIRAC